MAHYRDTDDAAEFVASAVSRETSPEIMEAIVFFARSRGEAEELWNGDGFGRICDLIDLWEHVTKNGLRDATDFCWGAAGTHWYADLGGEG